MTELQALVEFSVELFKFYNVDLFQRGYYQVRCSLRASPKLPVRVDVSLPQRKTARDIRERMEVIFPACTVDGTAVSKTIHILYRNDEVLLDDVMLFRAFILVDSHKIEETLERADFTLLVELWFTDEPFGPDQQRCIESVCVRTLRLHFLPTRGLHDHVPLLFDYSHLAAVTLTVHAALVALHQPHVKRSILHYVQSCNPRSTKPWLGASQRLNLRHASSKNEPAFFGNLSGGGTKCASGGSSSSRLAHARHVHQEVCSLLLAAHESLVARLRQLMKLLPPWQRAPVPAQPGDCLQRFNTLSEFAKGVDVEEEFAALANKDIAQLCAENILLWRQFLDAFTLKEPIHQYLAKVHHEARVRRFAEAFFVLDNPRQSAAGCYDANYQNYLAVSEMARRSRYLATLPPLPIQVVEADGDIATLPIIFEDQYQEIDEFARRRSVAGRKPGESQEERIPAPAPLVGQEDCSCGISAILESRALKRPGSSATSVSNNTQSTDIPADVVGVGEHSELQAGDVIKATLTLGPIPDRTATLPARHSKSLDQLRFLQGQGHTMTLPVRRPHALQSRGYRVRGERPESEALETGVPASKSSDCLDATVPPPARFRQGKKREVSVSTSTCTSTPEEAYRRLETSASVPFNLSAATVPVPGLGLRVSAASEEDQDGVGDVSASPLPPLRAIRSTVSLPSVLASLQTGFLLDSPVLTPRAGCRPGRHESMPNLLHPSPAPPAPTPAPPASVGLTSPVVPPAICSSEASPPSSSISVSGDVTSEQSGWVSHSSRRSSRDVSSGQLSPERDPLRRHSVAVPRHPGHLGLGLGLGLSGDLLRSRLKELARSSLPVMPPPPPPLPPLPLPLPLPLPDVAPQPDLLSKHDSTQQFPFPDVVSSSTCWALPPSLASYEEMQLPPPTQFSDAPPPPEPFRDAPDKLDIPPQHPPKRTVKKISPSQSTPSFPRDKAASASVSPVGSVKLSPTQTQSQRVSPSMGVRAKLSSTPLLLRKLSPRSVAAPVPAKRHKLNVDVVGCGASPRPLPLPLDSMRPWRRPVPITPGIGGANRSKSRREGEARSKSADRSGSSSSSSSCSSASSLGSKKTQLSINHSDAEEECDVEQQLILAAADQDAVSFAKAKEDFKRQMNFSGMIYSDFNTLASTLPYFHISDLYRPFSPAGLHLVVCVHGLSGNSYDLRLVKAFLELGLPGSNLEFIMSERNSCDTQTDFDTMGDRLVTEILYYVDTLGLNPTRISFVGHSLGNVIIRAALAKPKMKPLLGRLHTFLSLVGPHLGTLYNSSGLVNMGVWLLSRLKGSDSIVQLSCRDAPDLRQTFMYKLSQCSNLHLFKNVLLCGSSQDRYVPLHSARIELCKAAVKDSSLQGIAYREMVHNILHPIINNPDVTFVRYDVHHSFNAHTADALIGRAAHIAVLDSEKFLEKFLMVVGLKYFR